MPFRISDPELEQLLATPIEAAEAPVGAPHQPAAAPAPRVHDRLLAGSMPASPPLALRGLYRRLGTTIAFGGAAVVGALIWYFGGLFTLDYLADTFDEIAAFVAAAPWWQSWSIPVAVSAMELFLWPRRERRPHVFLIRLSLWLFILAFDILTTHRGVLPVISRQELPLPLSAEQRLWLNHSISLVLGAAFAYLPEKIARWVLADLWVMWGAPVWRVIKRGLDPQRSSA